MKNEEIDLISRLLGLIGRLSLWLGLAALVATAAFVFGMDYSLHHQDEADIYALIGLGVLLAMAAYLVRMARRRTQPWANVLALVPVLVLLLLLALWLAPYRGPQPRWQFRASGGKFQPRKPGQAVPPSQYDQLPSGH